MNKYNKELEHKIHITKKKLHECYYIIEEQTYIAKKLEHKLNQYDLCKFERLDPRIKKK